MRTSSSAAAAAAVVEEHSKGGGSGPCGVYSPLPKGERWPHRLGRQTPPLSPLPELCIGSSSATSRRTPGWQAPASSQEAAQLGGVCGLATGCWHAHLAVGLGAGPQAATAPRQLHSWTVVREGITRRDCTHLSERE